MMYWKLMLIFAIAVVTGCTNSLGPQAPCTLDENKQWVCNTAAPRPDGDQAARTVAPARVPYTVDVRLPRGSTTLKK